MPQNPIVAAIQMCSSENVSQNLSTAQELIQEAKSQGATLVVLPENFSFMGLTDGHKLSIAEKFGEGPIQDFLHNISKENKLWIIAGTIPLRTKDPSKIFAACLVFNPQGACVARYDKMHLFDATIPNTNHSYKESNFIIPGKDVVTVKTPNLNIGLSICYDLRFPELYRTQLRQGSNLLCVPSAFTEKTGKVHWEILLRARAIENLSFVIASNQSGTHTSGRVTYGHTMIINPWGEILAEIEQGVGVITSMLDLEFLNHIRNEFPSIEHRKL